MTNELQIIKVSGKEIPVIDSREVAEMIGKTHSNLMKDIQGSKDGKTVGIIPTLTKSNFDLVNYFIESSYKDAKGENRKCYLITKMGCELLGNKQQGEKGILFSAKYVERFNEYEKKLQEVNSKANLLLMIYEGGKDAVIASKQLTEIEVGEAVKPLEIELDKNKEWYSIKRVTKLMGCGKFDWRKLKEASKELGYDVERVFDKNYGTVNAYHIDAWNIVYPELELSAKSN